MAQADSKGGHDSNDRDDSLAEAAIEVGHHTETANWFGLTVNTDTVLLATAIAAVIVIGLAFFLRAKVTLDGCARRCAAVLGSDHGPAARPDRGRDRHEDRAVRAAACGDAVRVHPGRELAVGAAGAVHRFQTARSTSCLKPPAADINFVLALALFVFICYHAAGIWRRGIIGHPVKLLKGHVTLMAPINLVEEIAEADLVVAPTLWQHLRPAASWSR